MVTPEALTAWQSFLETTPANTPVMIPGLLTGSLPIGGGYPFWFDSPSIQLHCESDDGLRRFDPIIKRVNMDPKPDSYVYITYLCRDCQITQKTFAILLIRQGNDYDVEQLLLLCRQLQHGVSSLSW